MAVVDVLAQTDIFQGLPLDMLIRLVEGSVRRSFGTGARLAYEGDEVAHCLHVILVGQVRIERSLPDEDWPVVLAECGPGDVVGELGLFDGPRRRDSIVAAADTDTLELSAETLAGAMLAFPEAGAMLLPVLSRRLMSLEQLRRYFEPPARRM